MDKATVRIIRHMSYVAFLISGVSFLLALGVLLAFRTENLGTFTVVGDSMAPSLMDGDMVVYHPEAELARGDMVLFHRPPAWRLPERDDEPELLVKRVAAAPGDVISFTGYSFRVNGKEIYKMPVSYGCPVKPVTKTLGSDEFVAFGDNALRSLDSRWFFCQERATLSVPTSTVIASGSPYFTL